jgi:general secretion pathway protein E
MTAKLIGQILKEETSLTDGQLSGALAEQQQGSAQKIGEILMGQGAVSEDELLRSLARQWNMPYKRNISQEELNKELVLGLPFEFLKKHAVLPLAGNDGTVTVVMGDPLDVKAFDAVASVLGRSCKRVICPPAIIEEALSRCYYQDGDSSSAILEELGEGSDLARITTSSQTEDLLDVANRAPIVRLVNTIFYQAVQSRASDIHIEPFESEVKVRFRIDGVLHDRFTPPLQYVAALVSRLKIMANLNIAERRLPQDGRSKIKIGEKEIDIRVSIIPTSAGERVVLRLLDKTSARFGLSELGFGAKAEERFRHLVHMPHGIILLTGPTGSGKTTTLYASLSEINTEDRNILTVEDPIEYRLHGIGQMQVQPKINLTFANSLRHILRQDPDVIMVGEIRDLETAEIAIQAALTGHLVFSTLHTNDSASAVTRLLDMGIEPYLVSSSVIAIMAQRLVRLICARCKVSYPPGEDARLLSPDGSSLPEELWRGNGCEECLQTGYRGRTGIFELLLVDDEVRELVMRRAGANIVKQSAIRKGMRTLRDDGVRKALAGDTTVEEVMRVTQEDVIQYEV